MAARRKLAMSAPVSAPVEIGPELKLAGEGMASVASPARELQARLQQTYDATAGFPEPVIEPWPGAARMGVLVALVAASWSLVLGGAWAAGMAWSSLPMRL